MSLAIQRWAERAKAGDRTIAEEGRVAWESKAVEEERMLVEGDAMIEDWMADTIYEGHVYPRYSLGNWKLEMSYSNLSDAVNRIYCVEKDRWVSEHV